MAISKEFAQAVRERNILRIRIMLKDSLLLDKTFSLFGEMQKYAETQGINLWDDVDGALEKQEKPWTTDLMNYELTALVNDFTREHVNYVESIISDLYKTNTSEKVSMTGTPTQYNAGPSNHTNNRIRGFYLKILRNADHINRIIRKSKNPQTEKEIWTYDNIDRIREYAQNIVEACDELKRRR